MPLIDQLNRPGIFGDDPVGATPFQPPRDLCATGGSRRHFIRRLRFVFIGVSAEFSAKAPADVLAARCEYRL